MSEIVPAATAPSVVPPVTVVANPIIHPRNTPAFFAALGNSVRWQMFQILSAGEMLTATHMKKRLGGSFDSVSRHLRVLREGGVVSSKPGQDRRYEWFYIPSGFRAEPGVVNYGWCRIYLPQD